MNNTETYIVNYKYKEIQREVIWGTRDGESPRVKPLVPLLDGTVSKPNGPSSSLSEEIRLYTTLKSFNSLFPFIN